MNTIERKILQRVMVACNKIGSPMDGTAVSFEKLISFQRAHMYVSNVIYGVLMQHKDNDYAKEDLDKALKNLDKIEKVADF